VRKQGRTSRFLELSLDPSHSDVRNPLYAAQPVTMTGSDRRPSWDATSERDRLGLENSFQNFSELL